MDGVSLLVNTTNQGMHGQPGLDVQLDTLPTTALVSDAIYIPLETPLLAAARARGAQRAVPEIGGEQLPFRLFDPAILAILGVAAPNREDLAANEVAVREGGFLDHSLKLGPDFCVGVGIHGR